MVYLSGFSIEITRKNSEARDWGNGRQAAHNWSRLTPTVIAPIGLPVSSTTVMDA